MPIPSYDSVRSIPLFTVRGATTLAPAPDSGAGVPDIERRAVLAKLQASRDKAGSGLDPYWVEWDHVDSAFVSVAVGLDTSGLDPSLRLFLPLLLEVFFKLPCAPDGAEGGGGSLSKDEFVAGLQADTVRYSAGRGLLSGEVTSLACVFVQTELAGGSGLPLALAWLRRALYRTTLSAEHLNMAVKRLLSLTPAAIRDGSGVAAALLGRLELHAPSSNDCAAHAIAQQPFLEALASQLEDVDGAAAAIGRVEALRSELLRPSRMQTFVAVDVRRVTDPYAPLLACLVRTDVCTGTVGAPVNGVAAHTILSGRRGLAVVASLSAIESNFLRVGAPGIGAYSEDHASLLCAIEYLTALEGDFWVKLRGAGLTYSYGIRNSLDSRRLSFTLFKCGDMAGAYAAARAIALGYASGEMCISQVALDGAKSTVAYGVIAAASTRLSAAGQAWASTYLGKGVGYSKWLLSQVDAVTVEDALHALKKYIVPLFDASGANLAATCPSSKLDETSAAMEALLGVPVAKLTEDKLSASVDEALPSPGANGETAAAAAAAAAAAPAAKVSPFEFAKRFKCECPKCEDPPDPMAEECGPQGYRVGPEAAF